MDYIFIENLDDLLPQITAGSVVSKAFLKNEQVNVTLFGFDAGEGLTEHTAAFPAIVHILAGEGDFTLGSENHPIQAGAWIYMPPHLPHSLLAKTPLKMLLILVKS